MLKARFKGSIARATKSATTVLKSVNVESVFFDLDSSWDGLVAWACFKCNENGTEYHLMMPANHEVTIPWEIFTTEGRLYVGAVGYRDSEIVKPTTWLYLADVVKGVDPEGSISVIPTPTAFEQAMAALGDATDALDAAVQGIPNTIDTALAEAKASGEFDGADGQDGNNLWLVAASDTREVGGTVQALKSGLVGPSGASVQRGDVFVVSDGRVCSVLAVAATLAFGTVLGDMRGPIDAELSSTSENAVQNKAVYAALLQASFLIDDKVDKVDGKGLSSNDYTDSDKNKLEDAATETWTQDWVNSQGFLTSANEIPPGGNTDQILKKRSNTDYDVEWADESGGGGGVTIDDTLSIAGDAADAKAAGDAIAAKYTKPSGGIPASDMAPGVSAALGRAYTAVQPEDLEDYRTAEAQDTIDAAQDTAIAGKYSKPSGGIPKTDLAPGVIPTVPSAATSVPANIGTSAVGTSDKFAKADHVHDFNSDFVTALLQLAEKVAYIDGNGQTYYQALYDALNHVVTYTVTNTLSGCTSSNAAGTATAESSYSATITASAGYTLTGATVSVTMGGNDITSTAYNNGTISIASVSGNILITVTAVAVTMSSISAVYTQSGTVYPDEALDSLKADLVVTAIYSDSSTQTVPAADYTLSGTLTAGTSTITVSYGGKTTTFSVTVTNFLYAWDFKTSLVDTVGGTETFVNSATVSGGTIARDSSGLKFTTNNSGGFQGNCATKNAIITTGSEWIVTIKFGTMNGKLSTNANQNGFIVAVPIGVFWSTTHNCIRATKTDATVAVDFQTSDKNYFSGKTLVESIHSDGSVDFYADGALIGQANAGSFGVNKKVGFGTGSTKDTFGDMVIESVTVKAG